MDGVNGEGTLEEAGRTLEQWFENPDFVKTLVAIIGIIIIIAVVRVVHRTLIFRISDPSARYRTRKFITFLGYFTGLFLLGLVFNQRLGNLSVALGIIAAGVAFALQEVIASIGGWLAITFGDYYRVGDRIQLGEISGDVIDIGVFRTTLMEIGVWVAADQYTGRLVRVSNSFVFREPVFNYTSEFPFIWDEVRIPIRYGSNTSAAQEMFEKIAHEMFSEFADSVQEAWTRMVRRFLIENANLKPAVFLVTTDNWIEYTIRYITDPRIRRTVRSTLYSRILREVEKTEGKVQLASATFEVANIPSVDVNLKISDEEAVKIRNGGRADRGESTGKGAGKREYSGRES